MKNRRFLLALGVLVALIVGPLVSCASPAPTPAPAAPPAAAPVAAPTSAPVAAPVAAPTSAPVAAPAAAAKPALAAPAKPATQEFVPKAITISAFDVGSGGYTTLSTAFNAVAKKYNIRVRIVPAANDTSRLGLLRNKQVDMSSGGTEWYIASQGMFVYGSYEWGPLPLQAVWTPLRQEGIALGVRANSDIKTMADLKGKRLPWVPGNDVTNEYLLPGALAFANLTWKDVVKVEFPSAVAATQGIISGKVDTSILGTSGAPWYELESSPHGLRWLEWPIGDKEGWNRVKAKASAFYPAKVGVGAGLSKDKTKELATMVFPPLIVMDDADEKFTYFVAKALHESFVEYNAANPDLMSGWHIDTALKSLEASPVPIHKGAVQYFKDVGKWTPDLEKMNQAKLQQNQKVRQAWEKARDDSLDKGMKEQEFRPYWDKIRTELSN